jgi:hypothetical protein
LLALSCPCCLLRARAKDVIFTVIRIGLYYHDTTNRAVGMVNTIKENMEVCTDREYDRAKSARRALGHIGYPSPSDFKNMVRSNMIKNCSVTSTDIDNAHTLFDDDIATPRGKTVRNTQDPVMADYVEIPKEILDLNKEVTMAADMMFVNELPFVTTISRKINFATIEYMINRSEPNLIKYLSKIISLYKARGFAPSTAIMDREFECLCIDLLSHGVNLNTTAASEHVPDIERQIRLIKERARVIRSTLSFKIIPGRMVIKMLANAVLKEKRGGIVKGQSCADGRKKRETAVPGEVTSPIVSLTVVLMTATIDAYEERDVAIVDVPGAFLSANMDEEFLMTIHGRLAELMAKAATNIYRKYITINANNQPILYVKLEKALHGCLRSALLFYEKLVGDLKSQGFELNPYDPCMAKKIQKEISSPLLGILMVNVRAWLYMTDLV